MIKKLMLALSFASTVSWAQAAVLLTENFDAVDRLPGEGWVFENHSQPPGIAPGWVQGNPDVFTTHEGKEENDYIASSFESAGPGGKIDNRLFTPLFSLQNGAVATFWLRGGADVGFSDIVVYGYTSGAADPDAFIKSRIVTAPQDDWTQYTLTIDPMADTSARLGFIHTGEEATSNYVGLDTLRIDTLHEPTDVPEPAMLLIFGVGAAGLTLARRRR